MRNLYNRSVKKLLLGIFTLTLSGLCMTAGNAQDATAAAGDTGTTAGAQPTGQDFGAAISAALGGVLQQIAVNTGNTAAYINNIPTMLNNLLLEFLAATWLKQDESPGTGTLQQNFGNYDNALIFNLNTQLTMQPQLNKSLFGDSITPNNLPNANDMVYSILLNAPYFSPDPRDEKGKPYPYAAYNYVKNAAGLNVPHMLPQPSWRGSNDDINRYTNYYNSVMSIQSYNAFLLSGLYADYVNAGRNGGTTTSMQTTLVSQADDPTWVANVGGEHLGYVVRQMLLYQSQMFVLMTQLLQTQKQLLASSAMTNTLLILSNQNNEQIMARNASGQN